MSSQLKRLQTQLLSLFSVFVSSFVLDFAKNTILVILSACAPESYLKLIHLSSSQAHSPFIFCCSVMHCLYEEFFPAANDSVMAFDVAHVLLGHVKSHRSLLLLHFFPNICKIWTHTYSTVCYLMYCFFVDFDI